MCIVTVESVRNPLDEKIEIGAPTTTTPLSLLSLCDATTPVSSSSVNHQSNKQQSHSHSNSNLSHCLPLHLDSILLQPSNNNKTPSAIMTGDSSCCVSIRARVRKSKRAIDPEFDACVETLVSFTDNGKSAGGPSLILTPEPTTTTSTVAANAVIRARSLSRGAAPSRRRHRSFGQGSGVGVGAGGEHPHYARKQSSSSSNGDNHNNNSSSNTSGGNSDGENNGAMVDVSLEDEMEAEAPLNASNNSATTIDGLNKSNHSHSHNPLTTSNLRGSTTTGPAGLPKHPSQSNKRYSSPFAVHRTSSTNSNGGASSVVSTSQSDHLCSSLRSSKSNARSRSTSRSRSRRRIGGHMRMRSLGAANAFATAGPGGHMEDEAEGSAAQTEPIMIPLKDILSVDEEVPSRSGSNAGGSDFFSSAASDVGAAKEASERTLSLSKPNNSMASPRGLLSPPPSSHSGSKTPYRIFLHTLSHGYVEFSLDHNANSHDIFMAYLKAHLPPDRIPDRVESDAANNRGRQNNGNGGMLRTMVLTPTKEVPSNLSDGTGSIKPDETLDSANNSRFGHSNTAPRAQTPSLRRPPLVTRSKSEMSVNNIDKLHSKAIRQRLKDESTPIRRMKDRMADWMSTVMDCACCQDTTVAPLDVGRGGGGQGEEGSKNSLNAGGAATRSASTKQSVIEYSLVVEPPRNRSQNTERLRNKGIGGLSFEELSCGGTPKLSFERSVGGESSVKR